MVPAAQRLDVQRQGPPGAAEGPGAGSTPTARSTRSTTATASSSRATSSPSSATARPDREGRSRTIRRSASGSCSTTAGTRRCSATTSTLVTDPIDIDRPRSAVNGVRARRAGLRDRLRRRALPRPAARSAAAAAPSCATCGTTRTRAPTSAPPFPASRTCFMVYGPNTQPGTAAALIGSRGGAAALHPRPARADARRRHGAVEVRREVYDDYNRRVDAAHERMVWTHPAMETYYRNSRGRVVVTTPVPRRGLLAHDTRGGPRTTTSSSPPCARRSGHEWAAGGTRRDHHRRRGRDRQVAGRRLRGRGRACGDPGRRRRRARAAAASELGAIGFGVDIADAEAVDGAGGGRRGGVRASRLPRQQRRHPPPGVVPRARPRRVAAHARRQPDRHVHLLAGRDPAHAAGRAGGQHRLDRGRARAQEPDRVLDEQGRRSSG